jgi:hypothetical protein
MESSSANYRWWRLAALAGALFLVLPPVLEWVDSATHFRFESIDDHFDEIGLLIPLGIVLCFVGCIGWAKRLERTGRASLAFGVFVACCAEVLLGYLIDGMNVHGSAGLIVISLLPMPILIIVLWIMAARKPRESIERGASIGDGTDPAPPVES